MDVDLGKYGVSITPGEILKASSLGASVAVVIFEPSSGAAGLAHIGFPDSSVDSNRAALEPGYFADTGLPLLLDEISALSSASGGELAIKIAGGADLLASDSIFNLGERNVTAVREGIFLRELTISAQDVGGNLNRTVSIRAGDGKTEVSAPGRGNWEL